MPTILIVSVLTYVALAAILFGLAGRLDLPWFWATLVVFIASHLVMVWVVFRHDPGLVRERFKPGPGVPLWDKIVLRLTGVLMFANMAIAPLDVGRWHWSDSVTPMFQGIGLLSLTLGMSLMTWSMAVNTFFSKVVRIQDDRGQRVIDSGPYRFVRHRRLKHGLDPRRFDSKRPPKELCVFRGFFFWPLADSALANSLDLSVLLSGANNRQGSNEIGRGG